MRKRGGGGSGREKERERKEREKFSVFQVYFLKSHSSQFWARLKVEIRNSIQGPE